MVAATGDWMARGNNATTSIDWVVLNGEVVATTDTDVGIGTGETWSDVPFTDTFFVMQLNGAGDMVIGGTTSNPDVERDAVLVHICSDGTTSELVRQGDPVDVDGNGFFDDGAFVDVFNNDDAFLGDDGYYYFTADLQSSVGGAAIGQAFMRVPTPECTVPCPADLSGSSDPNDPAYGVPDGTVDSADFFFYLDLFVAGCA